MVGLRKNLWIGAMVFGLGLLALGSFFMVRGFDAKAEIRSAMEEEHVLLSADAVNFGLAEEASVPVTDAETARAEAEVIRTHSMAIKGTVLKSGQDTTLSYADMKKDLFVSDTAYTNARTTYLNGLNLRNSLNMAVMGFGLADLAIGSGVVLLLVGIAVLGIGVPALVFLRGPVPERVRRAELELQLQAKAIPVPSID